MFVLRAYTQFIPMRMNKSGNQSMPASADQLVTTWTADAAWPDTDILTNANKLTLKAGDLKTVTAAVQFTGTNGFNKSCKVFKNGVQIGSTQSSTSAGATFSFSIPNITFVDGDTLDVRTSASTAGITVVAAGTYIQVI